MDLRNIERLRSIMAWIAQKAPSLIFKAHISEAGTVSVMFTKNPDDGGVSIETKDGGIVLLNYRGNWAHITGGYFNIYNIIKAVDILEKSVHTILSKYYTILRRHKKEIESVIERIESDFGAEIVSEELSPKILEGRE